MRFADIDAVNQFADNDLLVAYRTVSGTNFDSYRLTLTASTFFFGLVGPFIHSKTRVESDQIPATRPRTVLRGFLPRRRSGARGPLLVLQPRSQGRNQDRYYDLPADVALVARILIWLTNRQSRSPTIGCFPYGRDLNLLNSFAMSTFVLVHGAWQSNGTWDLLVPLLERHGHKVITPILRGLGTDQTQLSSDVTLRQHVEDVSNVLEAAADKAVLVGHSYAGMVISGALESNPTKIETLVFLDAFIPEDGQCVLDLLPPQICSFFRNVARERGDGWRLPGGESQLDLWGLKPGQARDFVRERLCDFSLRCFEEPLPLRKNHKATVPATFVSCVAEQYPARPFFEPFAKKARTYGWQVKEVNTGHDCHVESPTEIVSILLSAAAGS